MENTKFEMGPLQKLWVASLRKHPERQMKESLGHGDAKEYKACCLGELHLCYNRMKHKKLPFDQGNRIFDIKDGSFSYLTDSWKKYGLRSDNGELRNSVKNTGSLAALNDNGISWTEIADIIEKDPGNVFTKSV